MNLRLLLSLGFACVLSAALHAETPEERAKAVTVTMNLNDVPPAAAAQFVSAVSKVKVFFQGHPGDKTVLTVRFALSFDWPDLPDLPSPDLPDLPNLPGIPLPDVSLPGWLLWILQHAKYVVPILVAWGLAQAEINRRRKQDELRAARRAEQAEREQD